MKGRGTLGAVPSASRAVQALAIGSLATLCALAALAASGCGLRGGGGGAAGAGGASLSARSIAAAQNDRAAPGPEARLASLAAAAGVLRGLGVELNATQALDLAAARLRLHARTPAHAAAAAAFRASLAAAGPTARRGIVIAAGGGGGGGTANLANAAVAAAVLVRALDCPLPIEVVHFGRSEGFAPLAAFFARLNATAAAGPGSSDDGVGRPQGQGGGGGGGPRSGPVLHLVDALEPRFATAAAAVAAPWESAPAWESLAGDGPPAGNGGGGEAGEAERSGGGGGAPMSFAAKVFALAFVTRFQEVRQAAGILVPPGANLELCSPSAARFALLPAPAAHAHRCPSVGVRRPPGAAAGCRQPAAGVPRAAVSFGGVPGAGQPLLAGCAVARSSSRPAAHAATAACVRRRRSPACPRLFTLRAPSDPPPRLSQTSGAAPGPTPPSTPALASPRRPGRATRPTGSPSRGSCCWTGAATLTCWRGCGCSTATAARCTRRCTAIRWEGSHAREGQPRQGRRARAARPTAPRAPRAGLKWRPSRGDAPHPLCAPLLHTGRTNAPATCGDPPPSRISALA
jgi:hypothetical protein